MSSGSFMLRRKERRKRQFKHYNMRRKIKAAEREEKMISGTEKQEVEMTDRMVERADELDNAVYDMLLTFLQLDSEEAKEEFPWNIEIIREVLDFVYSVLAREGKPVCNPYISDGSYRCTLSECGCRKCSCQTTFMERERIMGRVSEAMQLNDIEVTDNDGNKLLVREPLTGEEFEIAVKSIDELGTDFQSGDKAVQQ